MFSKKKELGSLYVGKIEDTTGTILGMLDDRGKETVSVNMDAIPNRNVVAFTSSFKSKFIRTMLAQICIRHESVVVSDATGELYDETSDWFRGFGYKVQRVHAREMVTEIDYEAPAKEPCAYYVVQLPQIKEPDPLNANLFSVFLNSFLTYADYQPNRRSKTPVNIILDEFSGSIVGLESIMLRLSMYGKKRGIFVTFVFKSLMDLQDLYSTEWETILANCATHIGFDFNDEATALLFVNKSSFIGSSGRHELDEGELYRMSRSDCIVGVQGQELIHCHKFTPNLHPI